jgi:hypothetical protein
MIPSGENKRGLGVLESREPAFEFLMQHHGAGNKA